MRIAAARLLLAGLLIALATPAALAQIGRIPVEEGGEVAPERPRRPYRGLFSGGETQGDVPGLNLSVPAFFGYDDNLLADSAGSGLRSTGISGRFGSVAPELRYVGRPRGATLRASAMSYWRIVEGDYGLQAGSHAGSVDLSIPVSRTWTIDARGSTEIAPYYRFESLSPLPPPVEGLPPVEAPSTSYDLATLETVRNFGRVGLSWTGRRSAVHSTYEAGRTRFDEPNRTANRWVGSIGYERGFTRHARLILGYRHTESHVGLQSRSTYTVQDIDLGGTYSRPLSFSRRTTISASGGTSVVDSASARQYRLALVGGIEHEIGRTWLLRGGYREGFQVIDAFDAPVMSRATRVGLDGLLNWRMDVSVEGGYQDGELVSSALVNPFAGYDVSARLRMAATRSLAVHVDYSYLVHDFESRAGLPTFLAPNTRRQAVRVGITYWLPLYTPRRSDAAR